ncbi:hypothetical protein LINPERHAP1_LOCUS20396 [Linum perenne]
MRSIEDKSCYSNGATTPAHNQQENPGNNGAISFEFHKGSRTINKNSSSSSSAQHNHRQQHHHRIALGKPTPSKWDDAQKWLVGLRGGGGGDKNQIQNPRNSNADDRRLIAPVPQQELEEEEGYSSGGEDGRGGGGDRTKKVECDDESIWRINKPAAGANNPVSAPPPAIRSICVRDMGTEMTPIASQEPSRSATPIRATTPAARSPMSSGSTTPVRGAAVHHHHHHNGVGGGGVVQEGFQIPTSGGGGGGGGRVNGSEMNSVIKMEDSGNGGNPVNPLEARASAWDEAERAKYMAVQKGRGEDSSMGES